MVACLFVLIHPFYGCLTCIIKGFWNFFVSLSCEGDKCSLAESYWEGNEGK